MQQFKARWRTCNCNEATVNGKPFHLDEGVVRSILEQINPRWRHVPKEPQQPCPHWQEGYGTIAPPNPKQEHEQHGVNNG